MNYFILTVLLSISIPALAQENVEGDLLFYGDVMLNAYEGKNRMRAAKEFTTLFDRHLEANPMLDTDADFQKYLSILNLEPNRKLITWHVNTTDFNCEFHGYFLEEGKKPIRLNRTEPLAAEMAFMTSTNDDWYGCRYYNYKQLSENQYLIMGMDISSEFDNQKIADILTINEDGTLTLGAPLFEDKESPGTYVNRIVLSFSSDASVNLNYNQDLDILILDHLEARMGLQAGQGATNIPDGTYEGYKEQDGKWMYVEKIFSHVYEEAPRPKPTQSGLFKK